MPAAFCFLVCGLVVIVVIAALIVIDGILAELIQVFNLQRLSGSDSHAGDGVLCHIAGNLSPLGQKPFQAIEQRAAACHADAVFRDIRSQLRRRPFQHAMNRFHDAV